MEEKNAQNFDEIKCRLLQFAEHQGIPKYKFYEKILVSPSNFAGKSAESNLSSSKIAEILRIFPELSADWLLLEKGEMLRKNCGKSVNVTSSPQSNVANGDMKIEAPAELVAIIAKQQETIAKQTSIIENLLNHE